MIGSLTQATEFLAEHDDYRPLDMNVELNGVTVAVSQILEKENPHVDLGGLGASNQSVVATA